MKAYSLIFVLVCETLALAPYHPVPYGTVLFSAQDVKKTKWHKKDLGMLISRWYFHHMIPPTSVDILADEDYVNRHVTFFQNAFLTINREARRAEDEKLMTDALSDTVGSYLKAKALPAVKCSFYAGALKHASAVKLFNLYNDIKHYLGTSGHNWKKVSVDCSAYKNLTPKSLTIRQDLSDPCQQLASIHKLPDGQMAVPTPKIRWKGRNSVIRLPLRNHSVYPLGSPRSADDLVHYYALVHDCLGPQPAAFQRFNRKFSKWFYREVQPHFNDDRLYPGLNGVLYLVNGGHNIKPRYKPIMISKNKIPQAGLLANPFQTSANTNLIEDDKSCHWLSMSMVVILILFLELVWCIPTCICMWCCRYKKKNKRETGPTDTSSGSVLDDRPRRLLRLKQHSEEAEAGALESIEQIMSNVESQHTKGSETETELKLKRRRSQRRRSRQRYSNDHINKIKFLTISESSGKLYKDSTVQMNSDIIKLARTTDRATCADYECGDCGTITVVKEFMTDNETHVSEDFIEASSRATAMETSPNVCSNATHIDKEFLCDNPISTYLYNKKEIYFSQTPEKSHADTKAEQVSMVISNYVTDSKSCDCSLDYEMPQIFAVATAASQPIPCEPKTDDTDLNVLFSSKGLNKKTNEEIISYSEDQYYMDEKQLDAFTLDISDHLIKKTSSHTSSSLSHNTSTPRNKHCAYESPRVSVGSAKSKLSEKSAIVERSDSGGADIRTCKSSYEIATVDMSASCTSYKTTAMKTFSEKSMVIQECGTSADTMSQETGYECTQPRSSTFLSEVGSLTLDLGDLSDHQDPTPETKALIPEDLGHDIPDSNAKYRDKRNIACVEIQLDLPTSTEVVVEVASKKNRPSRIPKLNSKAARTKSLDLRSTSNISSGDTASVKSHIPILTSKPRDDIAVNTATTETDSKINVTL